MLKPEHLVGSEDTQSGPDGQSQFDKRVAETCSRLRSRDGGPPWRAHDRAFARRQRPYRAFGSRLQASRPSCLDEDMTVEDAPADQREVLASGDGLGTAPDDRAYRPDVEGLRAVAVALVVLYHFGVPPFTGGLIGVDVFFVISGFVITGLLLREQEKTPKNALLDFYARRVRPILPAGTMVILATSQPAAYSSAHGSEPAPPATVGGLPCSSPTCTSRQGRCPHSTTTRPSRSRSSFTFCSPR